MEWIFELMGEKATANEGNKWLIISAHTVVSVLAFIICICCAAALGYTKTTPSPPTGSIYRDYEALQGNRKSLQDYCNTHNIKIDEAPMVSFNVATANFGGIFTETQTLMNPWTGSVNAAAVRLQVEGGARAVVFDIWPDPVDSAKPVICAMTDHREFWYARWWRSNGLARGTSNFSNWRLQTRNTLPVGEVLQTAVTAAFDSAPGTQNTDPFFMILNLHGAMTVPYLNRLGSTVETALQGYGMASQYANAGQQDKLCNAPVSHFMNRVFVIVVPDTNDAFYSLPGISNGPKFVEALKQTKMGQVMNAVQDSTHQIAFESGSLAQVQKPSQPNCVSAGGALLTPAQAGFCLVQPSIGGATTDNATAYANTSWTACQQAGAQFVAVNMFDPNSTDAVMSQFYDARNFDTYSFRR